MVKKIEKKEVAKKVEEKAVETKETKKATKKVEAEEPEEKEVDEMTIEELKEKIIDEEIATAKEIKKAIDGLNDKKAKKVLIEMLEDEGEDEGEEGEEVNLEEMDLDELKAYAIENEILSKKEIKAELEGLSDKKATAKLLELIGDASEEEGEEEEGETEAGDYDYEESEAKLVAELEEDSVLTKADLVSHYSTFAGLKKKEADKQLNMVFDFIGLLIINGCSFGYPDFGKFNVTLREARNGRNPSTGEKIKIEAKKQVKFKPATFIKDWINGDDEE